MSGSACQLGRKPLCNSSACETGNAAQTDSWLQRIKSLILTKEPPQNPSQTQRDSKSLDDLVVRSVTEGCSRQNKLLIHSRSRVNTSVGADKHRSRKGILPYCLPRTFPPKPSIHYRNYLNSGSASKACAFRHHYIIQRKYFNTSSSI